MWAQGEKYAAAVFSEITWTVLVYESTEERLIVGETATPTGPVP
jgi:hypothetical protein